MPKRQSLADAQTLFSSVTGPQRCAKVQQWPAVSPNRTSFHSLSLLVSGKEPKCPWARDYSSLCQLFLSLKWRRLELWVLTQFSCPKCHGRFVEVSNDHLLLRKLLKKQHIIGIRQIWHLVDITFGTLTTCSYSFNLLFLGC